MNFKTQISETIEYIISPLKGNWAFFIIFGLLISGNATWVPIRFPHGGWDYYWGPALSGLSRGFVISYIATFIVKLFNNFGGGKMDFLFFRYDTLYHINISYI